MMKETSKEEIMEKAKELHSHHKQWHFHMLTPTCTFNDKKGKHAFVLENMTDNETYVVYSNERFMEEGKILVKMLHGEKITEEPKKVHVINDKIKSVLESARLLNEKNILWHHHMLFPDCAFNKHKGKWNIVFENPENNKTTEILYEDEPKDDLKQVEVLFYSQKK